jgi:hypothetical protein
MCPCVVPLLISDCEAGNNLNFSKSSYVADNCMVLRSIREELKSFFK